MYETSAPSGTLIVRVQKVGFSAPRAYAYGAAFFQDASEDWMKLGTEERSVGKTYVSTQNVSEGNILRKHMLEPAEFKIRCRICLLVYFVIKR